jgi:hypothetical protein
VESNYVLFEKFGFSGCCGGRERHHSTNTIYFTHHGFLFFLSSCFILISIPNNSIVPDSQEELFDSGFEVCHSGILNSELAPSGRFSKSLRGQDGLYAVV